MNSARKFCQKIQVQRASMQQQAWLVQNSDITLWTRFPRPM